MSAKSQFDSVVRISQLIKTIENEGMKVTLGTDFTAYRDLRKFQFSERGLYPMFDVNCSFVDASNGFWIIGTDPDGELVHTQAILKLDLTGTLLEEHLTVHRNKYLTPGLTSDQSQASFSVPNSATRITGSVCYHGDFWLRGGDRGFRAKGLTGLLSRLTFEFAQNTWEPDFIFGLVPEVIAQKGIGVRYGYFHGEPGLWKTNDDRVLAEEWVVWMGKEDIRNLTNREVPKPRMIPRKPSYDHALTKPNGIHYSAMIEEAAL